jgi:hypothetical protein
LCHGPASFCVCDRSDRLKAGHLAGVIELDQIGETPLETAGQSIGQRQELSDNRIAA